MDNEKKIEYFVTVKMKYSGFLPSVVDDNHIKENIKSEIENSCGEIALNGEYYGDIDEEWSVFLDNIIDIDILSYSIDFCKSPFCEHCGENYTDFGVEINDGGTSWCLDCFSTNGYFTKKDYVEITEKLKNLRKEYLKNELKKIEE